MDLARFTPFFSATRHALATYLPARSSRSLGKGERVRVSVRMWDQNSDVTSNHERTQERPPHHHTGINLSQSFATKRLMRLAKLCAIATSLASLVMPSPASASDNEDVIILMSGHQLRGSITEQNDNYLTLSTAGGLMVLGTDRIDTINYGTDTPKDILDQESSPQQRAYFRDLRLAQMAFATNKRDEAYQLLEQHRQILDLDGMRLLALLIDSQDKPREALDLYRAYQAAGGQDAATLRRLRTIELAVKQFETDMAAYLAEGNKAPEATSFQNGLEARQGWRAEKPDFANPASVWIIDNPRLKEDTLLQIDANGGNKWKASATRRLRFNAEDRSIVTLRVFNAGDRSVPISVAIKTGNRHNYFESLSQQVPANKEWYPLQFNLRDDTFKSAADNYRQHAHQPDGLKDVRELQIQVHNRSSQATIVINDLYFISSEQPDVIVVPEPAERRPRPRREPAEIIPGVTE